MITRILLSTGDAIYPNFLSKEDREILRERCIRENITMQCACRTDIELSYGISSDMRIIPLHQHYEHLPWCSRFNTGKRNNACVYSEDGKATVYLKFNPLTFSIPSEKVEDEQESEEDESASVSDDGEEEVESETEEEKETEEKEKKEHLPDYSLRSMIKAINHDTYTLRLMSGKYPYLSEEYFLNALYARLKDVHIHGMDKSLRELNIEEDNISFFYAQVTGIQESNLIVRMRDKEFARFIIKPILAKACLEFENYYGVAPQKYLQERTLMAAGFVYKRRSNFGKEYKTIGRLCMFPVTHNGLYVESILERDVVEQLMDYAKKCKGQLLYPDKEDTLLSAIFRIPKMKKEGYIYIGHKPREAQIPYLFCKDQVPQEEDIEEFIREIGL